LVITYDLLETLSARTEVKFEYSENQIIPKEDSEPLSPELISYILSKDFNLATFQQQNPFEMAPSFNHTQLMTNLQEIIMQQINLTTYRVYNENMRVKKAFLGGFRIPDLTFTLRRSEIYQEGQLVNPTSIIEVLSPSTEKKDRHEKKEEYQALESLQEYVLIAQDKYKIEQYLRKGKTDWIVKIYDSLDQSCILTVGVKVTLNELYQNIEI